MPLSRGILLAEFGSEGVDLGASAVKGARAVDGVGGVAEFFVKRKLGSDAATGFEFTDAASKKSLELLLRCAEGDDEAIEIFRETGFEEERGFDESDIAKARALPGVELAGAWLARREDGEWS